MELGTELTVLDEDSLTAETLSTPYLGSRGRKLFGLEDRGERLTIGLPRDPIPFTPDGQRQGDRLYGIRPAGHRARRRCFTPSTWGATWAKL